jgi:hypothetical protein
MFAAQSNRGQHVFFVARNYDTNRDLPVIGAVGSVESTATGVETDFSAEVAAERGLERTGVESREMGRRRSDVLRHRIQSIFEDVVAGRKPESACGALCCFGTNSALFR